MGKSNLKKVRAMINHKINLADYYNSYVFPLAKGLTQISRSHTGSICPFHKERDPSFRYYADSNRFKCFGCGLAGDVVRLHQLAERHYKYRKLTDEDAIKELIQLYNLDIDLEKLIGETNPFQECREKLDVSHSNNAYSMVKLFDRNRRIIKSTALNIDERIKAFNDIDDMAVVIEMERLEG